MTSSSLVDSGTQQSGVGHTTLADSGIGAGSRQSDAARITTQTGSSIGVGTEAMEAT